MSALINTRSQDCDKRVIKLVGETSHQILGAKLPSNKQVLQLFFHNLRFVYPRAGIRVSAKLAVDSVVIFWKQARIPTRDINNCCVKLESMYKTWALILIRVKAKFAFNF